MHTEKRGTEIHLNKVEARAGSRNKTNRNALIAGLLLVVAAFVVVVGSGYLETDRTGADQVNSDEAGSKASTP
ncbi:hypothetical protein [Novosphingobium sp. JCM 18896]|uniref:hypothetical protein n=1 Tax=Novosphingobium sp. JCM 18896 TaxID=2989731 RepID=UPI0022231BDC|nr:hypothetical protein [Novosphingobium sp. JCM 18896]MCW1430215.1 hypothetical protein [Novosphingobium sp. JCM 18896]